MDFCVCCGEYVPEGSMVCSSCWRRYMENEVSEEEKEEFTDNAGVDNHCHIT